MLEASFGLNFFLKTPSEENRDGKRHVYLRVTVNRQVKDISTKRQWHPLKWNVRAGRATGNKEESKELNGYLDILTAKVYQAKKTLLDADKEVTAEAIKNILLGKTENEKTILEVFQEHNDQVVALLGTDFAAGTLERYKTSLDHTRNFIKWKYRVDDFEIKKLDYEFISQYEFWLKTVRKCAHNTTMKYLANFKKIVLLCVKKGWLTRDPFYGFKMTKRDVDRQALTESELRRVWNKDMGVGRLSHVKDIFLFCCYTGLAYADVYKLKRTEVIEGIDGGKWITINRQKTDTPSRIPLLPMALELMEKYQDHPQCVNENRVLPVLSNQKMNSYLKEIADLCVIEKNITFHLARHTFATTVTLTNGVPIESVSKMLGHRNIKTTQQYAKIVDRKISDDMTKLKHILCK
ncbi:site-specific integrase [Dyadobacter arcticus]|uniref:Site-specific recombinase XerD n=1 Tax=Dyadobacter arcticus TaxID=1078754 RepID=A0ABX0UHM6_9BACT|nr:site-specific integrase [Dyadobacter arcticus]NIJ52516.1 site-specific recombinase XerD [Dyadobacter arcticus]